jgi:hypothetical protein
MNKYDYGDVASEFRTATELDPNSGHAWDMLSWALCCQQLPDPVTTMRSRVCRKLKRQPLIISF